LNSNIEGLKNEYKFKLEIRSSKIRTSFNNPIVLQTLNVPSKAGPPRIVHLKGEKVVVFNKIENSRYLKIMHLLQ